MSGLKLGELLCTGLHSRDRRGLNFGAGVGGSCPSLSACARMEGSGFRQDRVMVAAVQLVYHTDLARRPSQGGKAGRPLLAELCPSEKVVQEPALSGLEIWLCYSLASYAASWGLRFLTPQMG